MRRRWFNVGIIPILLLLIFLPTAGIAELLPPPDFPLLEAVKKGDVQKVKAILDALPSTSSRAEIDRTGRSGETALSSAAGSGYLEIVQLLVEHGATVDAGWERGARTPLIEASGQGFLKIVQYLIANGADVNAKVNGVTALLAACRNDVFPFKTAGDRKRTISVLLENGADVNVQDGSWLKTGRTPLMYAVLQGDAALVQALLLKGARLDLKNKDGETALILAEKAKLEYITQVLEKAQSGTVTELPAGPMLPPLFDAAREGNLSKVKKLIAEGEEVDQHISSGSTPLMFAADGGSLEIVRYLLKQGADVNAKNGANNTALIFAATKGQGAVVSELLKKKAAVNVKNISKGDALIYAVIYKKTDAVRALLKAGAAVNDRYDNGKTALMIAAYNGSLDIAKLLIAGKSDVNTADNDGMTALMIACARGNADLVGALVKAGADIHHKAKNGDTALDKAIAGNHIPIVKVLLKGNDGIDRQEALFAATGGGNLEIVQLLMTRDTDVNRRGYAGGSLLMRAAEGDVALVKFLVERGANVNHKDDEGKTALMKAAGSFHSTRISSVKFLIDHGASPNAVNMRGETALILAAKRGQSDMVQALLEKGSAVAAKDKAGKSAWTYAVEGGYSEIAALLEKAGAARDYQDTEWKGNISAQKVAFIKVVETSQEWSELWMRAFAKPAPAIDFETVAVACVFLGHGADWLYSISFGKPFIRGNRMVVPFGLVEIQLRLSGPFKASGQYAMKVLEKKPGIPIILQDDSPASR